MTNEEISLRDYFEARWKAHGKEHEMLQTAMTTAVGELNRRLEEMNQFRAQIQTERGEFLLKSEYESRHRELETRIGTDKEGQDKAIKVLELRNSNWDGRMWAIGGIIFVLSGILSWMVNLGFKYWAK